jgi:hypothetical protein
MNKVISKIVQVAKNIALGFVVIVVLIIVVAQCTSSTPNNEESKVIQGGVNDVVYHCGARGEVGQTKEDLIKFIQDDKLPRIVASVKAIPASDIRGNLSSYTFMSCVEPENKAWKNKLAHYTNMLDVENKKIEAEKAKQDKIKAEQLAKKAKEKAAIDAILDAKFRLKTTCKASIEAVSLYGVDFSYSDGDRETTYVNDDGEFSYYHYIRQFKMGNAFGAMKKVEAECRGDINGLLTKLTVDGKNIKL